MAIKLLMTGVMTPVELTAYSNFAMTCIFTLAAAWEHGGVAAAFSTEWRSFAGLGPGSRWAVAATVPAAVGLSLSQAHTQNALSATGRARARVAEIPIPFVRVSRAISCFEIAQMRAVFVESVFLFK